MTEGPSSDLDPVVPDRCDDDRDTGWNEPTEDDDERITRERPPHW